MLRAAIVEKSKEHREYIRAGLAGAGMEIQVSEFTNDMIIWKTSMKMDLLLIFCC